MQEPLQKLQNLLQQPSHANTLSISDLILTNVNFNLIGGGGAVTLTLTNSNNCLETAKLVYHITSQIIEFLSRIEAFQKHLWLKKKFVLSTDYRLTLDRIPKKCYAQIIQYTAQLEAWKILFAIHEIESNLIKFEYTKLSPVDFSQRKPEPCSGYLPLHT